MDKHRPISPQRKKQLAWTALVIFVLLTAAVCWFVGRPMLRFVSEPEKFRLWVDGHGLWGRVLYVGMCFLQVVVAIIPGEPLEIAGGYAFGAVWGTVLCLIGLFLGSVVIFALVRRFGQCSSRQKSSTRCAFCRARRSGTSCSGSCSPCPVRRRICSATSRG